MRPWQRLWSTHGPRDGRELCPRCWRRPPPAPYPSLRLGAGGSREHRSHRTCGRGGAPRPCSAPEGCPPAPAPWSGAGPVYPLCLGPTADPPEFSIQVGVGTGWSPGDVSSFQIRGQTPHPSACGNFLGAKAVCPRGNVGAVPLPRGKLRLSWRVGSLGAPGGTSSQADTVPALGCQAGLHVHPTGLATAVQRAMGGCMPRAPNSSLNLSSMHLRGAIGLPQWPSPTAQPPALRGCPPAAPLGAQPVQGGASHQHLLRGPAHPTLGTRWLPMEGVAQGTGGHHPPALCPSIAQVN